VFPRPDAPAVGAFVLGFLSWRVHLLALSWSRRWLKRKSRPVSRTGRPAPALEWLAERIAPAVTATFVPGAGTLTIRGDNLDNTIPVSRDPAGTLLVNGGAVRVQGGTPTTPIPTPSPDRWKTRDLSLLLPWGVARVGLIDRSGREAI
jgi:hypothetical protein